MTPRHYLLQEVKHTEVRKGFCSSCGQPTARQRTWTRTVSPAFRNRDGSIKTPAQHREDILAAARRWSPNHDHWNCPAIRAERVARRLKSGAK